MLSEIPIQMIYLALILFGLIIGSFLNVCIYRLPREKSIVLPRSFCPKCRALIHWYDNVPVLSFLILKGKCRSCSRKISFRYPIVEILSAVFSCLIFYKFQAWLPYVFYFIFLSTSLIVITFIDLEHKLIPDLITLPGIIVGFAARQFLMHGDWYVVGIDSVLGVLVGGGVLALLGYSYEVIKKQEGIGGGDVKLAAMLGAFLGWKGIIFILFIGSVMGSIGGVILLLVYKKDSKYQIPFGPFLALGTFAYLFFGEAILSWYLSLF